MEQRAGQAEGVGNLNVKETDCCTTVASAAGDLAGQDKWVDLGSWKLTAKEAVAGAGAERRSEPVGQNRMLMEWYFAARKRVKLYMSTKECDSV